MEIAEFEEKDYEGPLYNQLLCGNHRISTPGQVFENAFGLDCALEADNAVFWGYFGYRNIPYGIQLADYRWGWVWRKYGRHRDMPNFPVNLLVQAKRPDYLLGRNQTLAPYGIPKEYWRFHIRKHQQPLLHKLERQLNHRALVVYASPAFHTISELNGRTENQDIVENSTFVRPEKMEGHHSWNYDQPGTFGVAASKPEKVYEEPFLSQLEVRLGNAPIETSPMEDLKLINASIQRVIEASQGNPLSEVFLNRSDRINELNIRNEAKLYAYAQHFFQIVNVTWLVAGNDKRANKKFNNARSSLGRANARRLT